MNETFCVSTTTSAYPLAVAGVPVSDSLGNQYFATTTCPSYATTTTSVIVSPTDLSMLWVTLGVALWLLVFFCVLTLTRYFTD